MSEPFFHWPAALDVAGSIGWLTAAIVISVGIRLAFGLPPRFEPDIWSLALYLIATDTTRHDTHLLWSVIYLWWLWHGSNLPWNRWRKQLASKLSSLTEVARASLRRQQAEAWS